MQHHRLIHWLRDHRHPIFLVGLLTFFIIPELVEKIFLVSIPFPLLLTILIVTSISIIRTSTRKSYVAYIVALVLVILIFIWNSHKESDDWARTAYVSLFGYFSVITFFLFIDLLNSKKITPSVIIGAFAGYFMIGVLAFFVFSLMDSAYPDTTNVDLSHSTGIQDMFYFSFITLTTIGYGDFAPSSVLGQKIAVLEGLTGQFYLAIVMAILVGKYLSNRSSE